MDQQTIYNPWKNEIGVLNIEIRREVKIQQTFYKIKKFSSNYVKIN